MTDNFKPNPRLLGLAEAIMGVQTDGVSWNQSASERETILGQFVLEVELSVLACQRDGLSVEELAALNMQRRSCFLELGAR